jgi:splicing factor 3B subunit 3
VRVLSVDPDDCLQPLSMQALPAKPVSLCINETQGGEGEQSTLYLSIGLENGVLLKTVIDPATGDLSDTRTRYVFTLTVFWEFLC